MKKISRQIKKINKEFTLNNLEQEKNRENIIQCYLKLLKKQRSLPTNKQIAEITGLNERTISIHKKDIIKDSSKAREAITPYIEPFVTTLLDNSINYKCVRSAKLLAQIMGLLEVDKNEININNNRISQVIISQKKVQKSEKGMPDDTP